MKNKILGVVAILFAIVFAGCSHMIQDLRIAVTELEVINSSMVNPENVVNVTVNDDIPEVPKPTLTYKLPDGTTRTVEGTVETDQDGKKKIKFDLNPVSPKVLGGELPGVIELPGYKPTTITVNYIPPVVVKLESDGITYTAGDDVQVSADENGTISEPVVKTNYTEDAINVEKKYYIEGSSEPVDWSAIQAYLNNPENKGKKVTVKVVAKPTPDTDPSSQTTTTFKIIKTEKPVLKIKQVDMTNPGNIITVFVDDNIPQNPKPTLTYKLPDGTEKIIIGTVVEYEDVNDLDENGNSKKKKKIIYDLNPIDSKLPGSNLPVVIRVNGYKPSGTSVDYIPPVNTTITYNGKNYTDGDSISITEKDDIDTITEPVVTTNYDEDKIVIKTTYTDENGNPIEDLNKDGKTDWNDVRKYIKDPENEGKKVTIKVEAEPNPDTDPSNKKITEVKISKTNKPVIKITKTEVKEPGDIITVYVDDDIPGDITPKPTVVIKLPDGTEKQVDGKVVEYEDKDDLDNDGNPKKKKKIIFDAKPIDPKVPGGQLPVIIDVEGYVPEKTTISYIPEVVITAVSDGIEYKNGDEIQLFTEDDGTTIREPEILTNYSDDAIVVTKKYYLENGTEVGDQDGDGNFDWKDVEKYLDKEGNENKKVTIKVIAKPNPDSDPSKQNKAQFIITKTDKPVLDVIETKIRVPENVIVVEIGENDEIPYTPRPVVIYKLQPGGEEVEIPGTVEEYEDTSTQPPVKRRRIIFDMNPVKPGTPTGNIPVIIQVHGHRTAQETVGYYPPIQTQVIYDGKVFEDGDDININDDEDINRLPQPVVITNYDDEDINVETIYEDEDGNPIGDVDGDGDKDWDDVKEYYKKPENKGKKIKIKVIATPKPDTDPTGKKETVIDFIPKPVVKIGKPETEEPAGTIYIPVDDDIPTNINPKPILIYESYPDGDEVEIEGEVEEYEDPDDLNDNGTPKKKKRIKFNWKPRPHAGKVPGTIIIPGYRPTPVEVEDYKPPIIVRVEVDGKDYDEGDEIIITNNKDNFPGKPTIHTNYDDENVEIEEEYLDEDGNPIGDVDGDGDKDWDDVKKYYEDPTNEGKKIKIKVDVTPKPDTEPTGKKTAEFEITPKPVIKIKEIEPTTEPEGIIIYTDEEEIPETPKPIIRYNRYPDGEPVEVEGVVEEYEDDSVVPPVKRRRIKFNYNPKPRGGKLPIQIEVEGYKPEVIETEYHPPIEIQVNFDGKPYGDKDEIKIDDDEDIDDFEPIIITNYNDEDIEEETSYEDEDGNPIGDLDGDSDTDWDDVKEYYKKPGKKGKRIKIKVKVTPKPDTEPTGKKEIEVDFVPKPVVKIGKPETKEPEGTVYFPVDDDIPTSPKPILIYESYPDGDEVQIEGEVEEYEDTSVEPPVIRKRIKFNWKPRPRAGKIPGTIIIDGYRPTPVEVEGYKPPVIIKIEKDGKPIEDGDEIILTGDDDDLPGRPTIITNYDDDDDDDDDDDGDDIEITERYEDKDGKPIEDLDGDGRTDWDDVVIYTKNPDNHDKFPITVTVTGKPKGDDTPILSKTVKFNITYRTVKIDITVNTKLFTLSAIREGNIVSFVVTTNLEEPSFIWFVDGVQQDGSADAVTIEGNAMQIDTTSMETGEHTVSVVTVKNGIPYSSEAALTVN